MDGLDALVAELQGDPMLDYRARIVRWVDRIENLYQEAVAHQNEPQKLLAAELAERFLATLRLSDRERVQVLNYAAQRLFDAGAYRAAVVVLAGLGREAATAETAFTLDWTMDLREACQFELQGAKRAGARTKSARSWHAIEVPVHFMTSRTLSSSGHKNPYLMFGGERADKLTFGKAIVSVPKNRLKGTLPRNRKDEDTSRRADIQRSAYYVLETLDVIDKAAGFHKAVHELANDDTLFVFVHGFRQSLASAVLHAAQIKADLELSGAAVSLAWPSFSNPAQYPSAARSIDDAMIDLFAPALDELIRAAKAARVCLVGHSLGCRVLLRVLRRIAVKGKLPAVDHVVLASADVPISEFTSGVGELKSLAKCLTAYASGADKALQAALVQPMEGRAGLFPEAIAGHVTCVDTEACSSHYSDWLRHSDFSETASVDLKELLKNNLPPSKRGLLEEVHASHGAAYWTAMLP